MVVFPMEKPASPWMVWLGLAGPIVLPVVCVFGSGWLFPPSEEATRCSAAEWGVQEAGQCLLYPESWKRRAEIGRLYDAPKEACPTMIARLSEVGFMEDEALTAAEWMEAHRSNLLHYWQAVKGRKFCDEVAAR